MSQRNEVSEPHVAHAFRIPFPDKEISGELLFDGQPLNGDRMLEHLDAGLVAGYKNFVKGLFSATSLSPEIRELAIVRVGHLSGCQYEVHHHSALAAELGVPDSKIADMEKKQPETLNAPESAAICFVDELVHAVRPSDAVLLEVRNHFSDREVLELVLVVGNWMMGARFVETIGLPVEDFAVKPS